jgi:hypothetical protein
MATCGDTNDDGATVTTMVNLQEKNQLLYPSALSGLNLEPLRTDILNRTVVWRHARDVTKHSISKV